MAFTGWKPLVKRIVEVGKEQILAIDFLAVLGQELFQCVSRQFFSLLLVIGHDDGQTQAARDGRQLQVHERPHELGSFVFEPGQQLLLRNLHDQVGHIDHRDPRIAGKDRTGILSIGALNPMGCVWL